MKLYLITRTDNWGYDEYDSVVVCAKTRIKAMLICNTMFNEEHMNVEFIGIANKKQEEGIILSSFNAG